MVSSTSSARRRPPRKPAKSSRPPSARRWDRRRHSALRPDRPSCRRPKRRLPGSGARGDHRDTRCDVANWDAPHDGWPPHRDRGHRGPLQGVRKCCGTVRTGCQRAALQHGGPPRRRGDCLARPVECGGGRRACGQGGLILPNSKGQKLRSTLKTIIGAASDEAPVDEGTQYLRQAAAKASEPGAAKPLEGEEIRPPACRARRPCES